MLDPRADRADDAPLTVAEAVRALAASFADAGLPSAKLDARLLVAHVLGMTPERLILDAGKTLGAAQRASLDHASRRRIEREPVSRILGSREFWGLPFKISAATLDPRPDSETLIEAALRICDEEGGRDRPLKILDLGTGSGCLLLSMLWEMHSSRGIGSDISDIALEIARENASALNLAGRADFVQSNWFEKISGCFDVIISNPPYVRKTDIGDLEAEVSRYDPHTALNGGISGLDAYEAMIPRLAPHLTLGGWALLEVGVGQAEYVSALLLEQHFNCVKVERDLSGIARVVAGKRQNADHP